MVGAARYDVLDDRARDPVEVVRPRVTSRDDQEVRVRIRAPAEEREQSRDRRQRAEAHERRADGLSPTATREVGGCREEKRQCERYPRAVEPRSEEIDAERAEPAKDARRDEEQDGRSHDANDMGFAFDPQTRLF